MLPSAPTTDGSSASRKAWQLLPHDPAAIERLSRSLNVAPVVAQLLLNRKLAEPSQAQRFLQSPLNALHEPELLPGVPAAATRLHAAVQEQRKICIYGDYDVDGVSGTAILLTCLRLLGAQVEFHVPDRLEEGYGLNRGALQRLAENGVKTVVTVDCGIASVAEAEEARRLGLELIVTDHHEFKTTLPAADVLVHPRLPGDGNGAGYPFGGLCGAGVAFKLAWALAKRASGGDKVTPRLREFLLDAVVLAALGTVADVVPLFEENRVFVRHGLTRMRAQPSLGLQALMRCAKLEGKSCLDAGHIGFSLAPRINAAGRLGTARLAVELLTTSNRQRADVLADFLERQNHERQVLERRMLQEARTLAEQFCGHPALVLASADWHPGLLGIVASRLVDQVSRPVLLIALRDGQPHGQGSGRSVPGFPLHRALEECTGDLLSHGGHATAAGFRIVPEQIAAFRERFSAVAQRHFGSEPPPQRLLLDAEVPLSVLTSQVMLALEQLEPYGAGNPAPLLLADRLQVVGEPKRVGNGERHLMFRVRQRGRELKAIAFGMADRVQELMSQGGQVSLVFTPRLNEWQGFRTLEIEVKDFQAGPNARLD
jgi:single-stranded-DNA-specific exonuclease